MRHKARSSQWTQTGRTPEQRHHGRCPHCGKLRYDDRVTARRAAKNMYPSERMHAYRCGDYWHYGHHMKQEN